MVSCPPVDVVPNHRPRFSGLTPVRSRCRGTLAADPGGTRSGTFLRSHVPRRAVRPNLLPEEAGVPLNRYSPSPAAVARAHPPQKRESSSLSFPRRRVLLRPGVGPPFGLLGSGLL